MEDKELSSSTSELSPGGIAGLTCYQRIPHSESMYKQWGHLNHASQAPRRKHSAHLVITRTLGHEAFNDIGHVLQQ